MEYRDYYATLGVARDASPADVKRAYRKLARQHHPDLNKADAAAERRFKEINEANAVLGDPKKRRLYDQLGQDWSGYERGSRRPGAQDPFAGFSGSPGFGGNVRVEFNGDAEDLAGFSDFFRTFFTGARRGNAPGATRAGSAGSNGRGSTPPPVPEAEASISLDEAFHGTTRIVKIDERKVELRIPPGVASGQRLRIRGKGGNGADVDVRVKIHEHPVFSRAGADLERELPLTFAEAMLGAEVPVETLKGRVMLRIPPETQAGRIFRLAGQGMPHFRGEGHGDLLVRTRVVLPSGLDDQARRLARDLADRVDQPDPRGGSPRAAQGRRP
jgi:curved DNA-binding protein